MTSVNFLEHTYPFLESSLADLWVTARKNGGVTNGEFFCAKGSFKWLVVDMDHPRYKEFDDRMLRDAE